MHHHYVIAYGSLTFGGVNQAMCYRCPRSDGVVHLRVLLGSVGLLTC